MSKKDKSFWGNTKFDSDTKPKGDKRHLHIFLLISAVLVFGVAASLAFDSGNKEQSEIPVIKNICEYDTNSEQSFYEMVNKYRATKGLDSLSLSSSLSEYQAAVVSEFEKTGTVNENLQNLTGWQEKSLKENQRVYLNKFNVFGAATNKSPCLVFEYLKNDNSNILTSPVYDTIGIGVGKKYIALIMGQKTDKPNYSNTDKSYFNMFRNQVLSTDYSRLAGSPYYIPESSKEHESETSNDNNGTKSQIIVRKTAEEIEACINSYQSEINSLESNRQTDLRDETLRYAAEMKSLGSSYGGDIAITKKNAELNHERTLRRINLDYDSRITIAKRNQEDCSY